MSLRALVDDVRVFLVATALVVLAAVVLPVAQTHPAEVGLAVRALLLTNDNKVMTPSFYTEINDQIFIIHHVIASTVFLDANLTLRTLKRKV